MVCQKCGISVPEGKNFCSNCDLAGSYGSLENSKKSESWVNFKNIIWSVIVVILIVASFSSRILRIINRRAENQNNQALTELNEGGDVEKVIEQLDKANKTATNDDLKVVALMNKAYIYEGEEKTDLAKESFKEALSLTKTGSYDNYLISGEIANLENNFGLALENYKKAYELKPNEYLVNNALALWYLAEQDYPKSLEYAKKAEQFSDEFSKDQAKENLAVISYYNKNYNEALKLFLSFKDLDKKPYLYQWIAYTYYGMNDEVNAKISLKKAKDLGAELSLEDEEFLNK